MEPSTQLSFSQRRDKTDLPKQLLSLDGGGVKGISSLCILNAIMEEVKNREIRDGTNTSTQHRKPVDYFHLATGTSTGGLIALMLFRLHMNVPEVIAQYENISKDLFSPRVFGFPLHRLGVFGYWLGNGWLKAKAVFSKSQFSDEPMKEAIDKIVGKYGFDDADRQAGGAAMLRHKDAGKM
jgi:patatin-like phospholipase/acyl hydrolase